MDINKLHTTQKKNKRISKMPKFKNVLNLIHWQLLLFYSILTVATLMWLLRPGWTATILPNNQDKGGLVSSFTRTKVLSFISTDRSFHFVRCCRLWNYSIFQRFQKTEPTANGLMCLILKAKGQDMGMNLRAP